MRRHPIFHSLNRLCTIGGQSQERTRLSGAASVAILSICSYCGFALLASEMEEGETRAFITRGALIAASRPRFIERAYILACAIAVTLAIGVSRVYLGVHWATDVVAGWAFGAAWALVSLAPMHFLIRDRTYATGRAASPT